MSKANHVPYTWKEIEAQLREAILCQFSIFECLGPNSDDLGRLYLGIDPDLLDQQETGRTSEEVGMVVKSIPLERHHLHHLATNAYAYAYQLEGCEKASGDDHYEISCAVLNGFPQADMHGSPSPLSDINDFPLRRMFDTFLARWNLYNPEFGPGLSIRELALLSNMTVPAARTSLSKEGFKLETQAARGDIGRREDDKSATLNIKDAMLWLSRRRGFTPNGSRTAEEPEAVIAGIFASEGYTFDHALRQAMVALHTEAPMLAAEINVSSHWMSGLTKGEAVDIDIAGLRAIARKMKLPEAEIAARAVQHLIGLEIARVTQFAE